MKKILLLLTLISSYSFAQFFEQDPLSMDVSGYNAFDVADFNGDSRNDLLYANEFGFFWSESDGDDNYYKIHQVYSIPAELARFYINNLLSEDVDEDGDMDIVFSSSGDDFIGLVWIENLGDGEFSDINIIYETTCQSIIFNDMDGDGSKDIIIDIRGGRVDYINAIIILKNLGGGTFDTPVLVDSFDSYDRILNTGDLDEDGDLDLIVSTTLENEILWYENTGALTFSAASLITDDVNNVMSMIPNDIDEDGDLDLVFNSLHDSKVVWQENLGGGVFGDEHLISDFGYLCI